MKKGRLIMMLAATALGLVYLVLIRASHALTGSARSDGILGVALGLCIAAYPAAGFLDLFFFERDSRFRFSLRWPAMLWLALDLAVLFIAWAVIYGGLLFLLGKGGYQGLRP